MSGLHVQTTTLANVRDHLSFQEAPAGRRRQVGRQTSPYALDQMANEGWTSHLA